MSSSAEAELGELLINCKESTPERQSQEEMGHTQPPKPIKTDNTTTHGVVTNNIYSKQLKSMDMRLHWLQCRATQVKFRHYWRSEGTDLGDYATKHHAAIHPLALRLIYLTPKRQLYMLRNRVIPRGILPEEQIRSKGVLDTSVRTAG